MKALCYTRCSTREQADDGHGLDSQREALERYCAFKGFAGVELFVDAGISGSVPLVERPAGAALLGRIAELAREATQNRRGSSGASRRRSARKGGAGPEENDCGIAVVAMKLDRLFRDASDCLATTAAWDATGVSLHLLDLGLDTSSPMGRAFLTMAAAFAELERNLISERTSAGLEAARQKGVHTGRAPFGFRHDEDGRLFFDASSPAACTAQDIVYSHNHGMSNRAIARLLNDSKSATPQGGSEWGESSVRSVLRSLRQLSPELLRSAGLELR